MLLEDNLIADDKNNHIHDKPVISVSDFKSQFTGHDNAGFYLVKPLSTVI